MALGVAALMAEGNQSQFQAYPKIPRLYRDCVITEKIDGTNACVVVVEGEHYGTTTRVVGAQSRKRVIYPDSDNFGFAAWVKEHEQQLKELGPGHHFGEWWGLGIQRGYDLDDKRFSLFNPDTANIPPCCDVVPVMYRGQFDTYVPKALCYQLRTMGSRAAPGFMDPEGVVVYHTKARQLFKVTLEDDDQPKGTE